MSSEYNRKNDEVTTKLNQISPENGYDAIRATVGDFGRWQLKISILMALIKFPIAWFQMSIVFLAPPTDFWCKKWPEYENITDVQWLGQITPADKSSLQYGINRGFCLMKDVSAHNMLNNQNSTSLIPCREYSYNRSLFMSTITTEWDLVCDRQKFMDFSQVSLMFGVLLGNIIFGVLADKHGRKKVLVTCLLFQFVFGIFASLSPFLWLFIFLRFLLALANGGTMVTTFVICMEVVGGKWRTIVPIVYQIPFGFGYALLSVFAYFIRDWRYFHLALSVFSMPYVLLYWLIPESPRWLLAIGKRQQALEILEKAAKENKADTFDINNAMTSLSNERAKGNENKISMRALFSTRKMKQRSYLLSINWAVAGMTFYAFIQYMGNVSQNIFVTVALGGLVSLPGTVICVFLVSNYGRRLTIIYSYLLTAVCSLLILAFPKGEYVFDWPRLILAGIGIIGLSVSIPAMYLLTGELYPTVLRNSGVGFAMMFSRLGSMVAPLLISLENIAIYLPLLVIGIFKVIQAILILPLPETQGKALADTIEDLENREHYKQSDDSVHLEQQKNAE